jgi:serine protease Do
MSLTADVADGVGRAVVGLREGARGGSGVLVAPGVAATLARNVHQDELVVRIAGGADRTASVIGVDRSVDLAVLRIDDAPTDVAGWADDAPRLGQEIVALADPAGRGLRVTGGTVASSPRDVRGPSGRLIPGAIEHTAPLPRGSGGGPLVDASGRVLGLNALRLDGGLLLAWPATLLKDRVDALAAGTRTAPRRLGVALAGARQTRRLRAAVGLDDVPGLLVRNVEPDGPAARAGLTRGDLLVSAAGAPVRGIDDIHAALDTAGHGRLTLELLRGAQQLTVEVGADEEVAS